MDSPYIKPALATRIRDQIMPRVFATQEALGETIDLVLYRDADVDGGEEALPYQTVLMSLAAREPAAQRSEVTFYQGQDGEFAKRDPFNVRPGDRFRLRNTATGVRGAAGTVNIVLPSEGGVTRALFTLRG